MCSTRSCKFLRGIQGGGLRKLLNAMDIPIPSEEFENNVFGDEDKLLKNDPIEEELENIYSDQFQLQ